MTGVKLSADSALQGMANLVAIGLEKARAQEAATRAEAAREGDELKSVLLDALAHEFKTPLTTIKASTTALLSGHSVECGDNSAITSRCSKRDDRNRSAERVW